MTGKTMFNRLTAAVVLLLLAAVPMFAAAHGTADFTRYVALGDSLTAGFTSGSLLEKHQRNSFPAVIARQAGTPDFQQPLVSEPGIPAELQLVSISPLVIQPKASTNGAPTNLTLPRPYNNLGIPGATATDLLTLTGKEPATGTAKIFAQFILRGLAPAVQQAIALHPTFVTVWIGNNDVLGAVLSGTPAALTSAEEFATSYKTLIGALVQNAPNAGIVTATIPDVTVIPYATTLPPFLVNPATSQPVLGPDGKPIYYVTDLGGGNFGQLTPGALVTLPAAAYLASGYGIPAALAPLFPTLPNVGKPLPDAVTLTLDEVTQIRSRLAEDNATIVSTAAAANIPVVDTNAALNRYKTGVTVGGIRLTTSFLTGGIFGYDGFHPSDIGYMVVANEFIRTINANYGTDIPVETLTNYMQYNAPDEVVSSDFREGDPFVFSLAAWDNVMKSMGLSMIIPQIDQPAPAPAPSRGRATRR